MRKKTDLTRRDNKNGTRRAAKEERRERAKHNDSMIGISLGAAKPGGTARVKRPDAV